MRDFADKVVVITGAGSGIGRATARAFAARGARVHVVDIDGRRASAVAAGIRASGASAIAHTADCADAEQVAGMAAAVYDADGRTDILVNNAGIGHGGPIETTSLEDWRHVMAVNLWGVIHGIHAFLPRMLDQGGTSHIVNNASCLGLFALPHMAPYCATKFAIVGLSESLAHELRPRGIFVTVICPGLIATNIVDAAVIDAESVSRQRLQRLFERCAAPPERVAEDILLAVRKRRVIQTSPTVHVKPISWARASAFPVYSRAVGALFRRLV